MLTVKWTDKFRYSHMVEYYIALKMTKLLLHETTWMSFRNITLINKDRHKRVRIIQYHLYKVQKQAKLTYDDINQNKDCTMGMVVAGRECEKVNFWGAGNGSL